MLAQPRGFLNPTQAKTAINETTKEKQQPTQPIIPFREDEIARVSPNSPSDVTRKPSWSGTPASFFKVTVITVITGVIALFVVWSKRPGIDLVMLLSLIAIGAGVWGLIRGRVVRLA